MHEGIETKRLNRTGRFQVHVMEDALRSGVGGFGDDAIVDLWSNVSEEWVDVSSDHWGETTEGAIQVLVSAVPVPISYQPEYDRYAGDDPALVALVQWLANKHSTTTAEVLSELHAIFVDLAGE